MRPADPPTYCLDVRILCLVRDRGPLTNHELTDALGEYEMRTPYPRVCNRTRELRIRGLLGYEKERLAGPAFPGKGGYRFFALTELGASRIARKDLGIDPPLMTGG